MAESRWAVAFEGLSQYRTPLSFELAKKKMNFVFDDGKTMLVDFIDGETLSYTMDGVTLIQKYECMKADETIYMVMSEKKGAYPREGFMLVIDTMKRLVTGNFVKQGAVASYEKLVTREVRFGYIDVPGKKVPTERHAYTEDLVGKTFEWTYNPDVKVKHFYDTKDTYHYEMPMPDGTTMSYEEKVIYVKLNDYMYIFSFIEENEGTGTEGFIVMNVDRMSDVGCFWGVNGEDKPEAYCFAAYGKVIEG